MMGRGITGIEEVRGTNYYVKNKLHGYTVQCGEYSQYFITINGLAITFKNCESLYCIPVTYTILYINYTSIKKYEKPLLLL